MRTILLASGYNKRVRHLFPNLPKVMFPLGGQPYLKYWLDMLLSQETDVIILVQYLSPVIKKYVQESYPKEFNNGKIKLVERPENLGPVRAIAQLKNMIDSEFAIVYCDTLFRVNLDSAKKVLGDDFAGLTFITADELNMFRSE